MNADEEYSESNTIFGALCTPTPGTVTDSVGSDASAIPGFRGKRHVRNYVLLSVANWATRSLAIVWG